MRPEITGDFFLFIEEIHINANKSEESIPNPRIAFQ